MKEYYISPVLNVICFASVERLANDEELLEIGTMTDISTYGAKEPGASIEDEDFGLDIL